LRQRQPLELSDLGFPWRKAVSCGGSCDLEFDPDDLDIQGRKDRPKDENMLLSASSNGSNSLGSYYT